MHRRNIGNCEATKKFSNVNDNVNDNIKHQYQTSIPNINFNDIANFFNFSKSVFKKLDSDSHLETTNNK